MIKGKWHYRLLVGSVVIGAELGREDRGSIPATVIRRGLEPLDVRTDPSFFHIPVSKLLEIFHDDEGNSDVKLVVVKGNGRAFCAGGDVAAVVRDARGGDWRFGAIFLGTQYKLNYFMATYSKPQVSILNGIVMGGGAGASMHGRFRVVTENTVFAMPETALGLFPDVGASYFLSRLAGFF
ncbi:3-hydroxyisobutyryl-CoA hydrolase 1-like protein, partial [Trifolium pratense]